MAVQTVVRTIGTASRQYSTLQAWEDGAPVDLTTAAKYTCATFSGAFTNGETVTGGTSGFTGKMIDSNGSTYMIISDATGAFTNGETLTGGTSLKTCVITTPATDTGVIWQGQAYKDSTFSAATTVGGSTTSSTCYKELTAGAGQSFVDNSLAYATPLRYNATNGVALAVSGSYLIAFVVSETNAVVRRFQISVGPNAVCLSGTVQLVDQGIFEGGRSNSTDSATVAISTGKITNCLVKHSRATSLGIKLAGNASAYNCTTYTFTAGTTAGVGFDYATGTAVNCAMFGADSAIKAANSPSASYVSCMANNTTVSSGITGSIPFSTVTFTNLTDGSEDMRLVAGSALINAGTTDLTNAPTDIIGRTRVAGQFDVGCIEYQPYTTTVKTIGSTGDYSTLQAWEDAAPTNLVFENTVWQGQCQNQTFNGGTSAILTVIGSISSSTCYKELTTVSGASFRDNANVQTNALRYDPANGSAITASAPYTGVLVFQENYNRCSNLQVAQTGSSTAVYSSQFAAQVFTATNCIFEAAVASAALTYGPQSLINCLLVRRGGSGGSIAFAGGSGVNTLYNCTLVYTGSATDVYALGGNYSGVVVQNCAMFNVFAVKSGAAATYINCYTNATSPPAGCTTIPYDTSTGSGFQNITDATRDFRIKNTSAMVDTGVTDTINASVDIAGTPRPYAKAFDVGCWEYNGGYVLPYQPDSLPTTWTASPGPDYWQMVADAVVSDGDYVKSPPLDGTQGPLIMTLRTPMAAGTWTWNTRAQMGGTGRQVRVTMLNAAGVSVGDSGWQSLTSSFTTYTLTVTSSATATSIMLEAQ